MASIRATFDGRVFVPEGPVHLAPGTVVEVEVNGGVGGGAPSTRDGPAPASVDELLASAERLADAADDLPTDYSQQLDHYLYGTPKKD